MPQTNPILHPLPFTRLHSNPQCSRGTLYPQPVNMTRKQAVPKQKPNNTSIFPVLPPARVTLKEAFPTVSQRGARICTLGVIRIHPCMQRRHGTRQPESASLPGATVVSGRRSRFSALALNLGQAGYK